MPTPTDIGTGARIAAHRRLHRLTQQQLATRANVSYSLLVKVEQGRRPASGALIASAAKAMGVSVTTITGQPYTTDHTRDRLDGPLPISGQPSITSTSLWTSCRSGPR
ncbi:helix-turn-helix transcriptional regulator [Streptomyces sp. M10(2022)]